MPERTLNFDPRHFDAIVAGTKRATTRFEDPVAIGPVVFEFDFPEGTRRLDGVIDAIEPRLFAELSDEDARLEGLGSGDDLRAVLLEYYPGATAETPMEFVRFSLRE